MDEEIFECKYVNSATGTVREYIDDTRDMLNDKIKENTDRIIILEEDNESNKERISNLEKDNESNKERITNLEEKVTQNANDITSLIKKDEEIISRLDGHQQQTI